MTSLYDEKEIDRKRTKPDTDDQAERHADLFNQGHVFGMIGSHRLEGTPETVADMHRCDDHRDDIKDNIDGIIKCPGYDFINSCSGFINKMKIYKVKNYECQKNNTRIGHGSGAEASSPGTFVYRISLRPCLQVLIKKGGAC